MSHTMIIDADFKDDLYCSVNSVMADAYEYTMKAINPGFVSSWKDPDYKSIDGMDIYTIDFEHHTLKVKIQLNADNDLEITSEIFEFRYIHSVYLNGTNALTEYYAIQSFVLNRLMNRVEYHRNDMIYEKEDKHLENQEKLGEMRVDNNDW